MSYVKCDLCVHRGCLNKTTGKKITCDSCIKRLKEKRNDEK